MLVLRTPDLVLGNELLKLRRWHKDHHEMIEMDCDISIFSHLLVAVGTFALPEGSFLFARLGYFSFEVPDRVPKENLNAMIATLLLVTIFLFLCLLLCRLLRFCFFLSLGLRCSSEFELEPRRTK